jgi:hypothetical protein
MNIERYLLRRVLFVRNVHDLSELFKDIEEALAKPKKEPEPLSNAKMADMIDFVLEGGDMYDLVRQVEKYHGIGE